MSFYRPPLRTDWMLTEARRMSNLVESLWYAGGHDRTVLCIVYGAH